MDVRDTPDEARFRGEVHSFIERERPVDLRWRGGLRSSFDPSAPLRTGSGRASDAHHNYERMARVSGSPWPRLYTEARLPRSRLPRIRQA